VTLRHLLSWKSLFYDAALPPLRALGPARGDALLGTLGRLVSMCQPGRRAQIEASVARAKEALGAGWDVAATARALAANIPRYLARDYPIDGAEDAHILSRFDVAGARHLDDALAAGRGVIVVGSHLGAHVAGLHWLYRRGVPFRLLVQRPGHVSRSLKTRFDDDGPHPQPRLFLRRGLATGDAAERLLRAHSALRDGYAVYLNGDIPWPGPNARPGRFLGRDRAFLAIWADLAILSRAPALFVTCTHLPRGRYSLEISPPFDLRAGDEPAAVASYLARLESAIRAHPADAVAHLTWPCFGPEPAPMPCERARSRGAIQAEGGAAQADAPRTPGGAAPQPSFSRRVR
jgi:lauroyl/myristoyl acyltransferase